LEEEAVCDPRFARLYDRVMTDALQAHLGQWFMDAFRSSLKSGAAFLCAGTMNLGCTMGRTLLDSSHPASLLLALILYEKVADRLLKQGTGCGSFLKSIKNDFYSSNDISTQIALSKVKYRSTWVRRGLGAHRKALKREFLVQKNKGTVCYVKQYETFNL
jgi:hypothetical protein